MPSGIQLRDFARAPRLPLSTQCAIDATELPLISRIAEGFGKISAHAPAGTQVAIRPKPGSRFRPQRPDRRRGRRDARGCRRATVAAMPHFSTMCAGSKPTMPPREYRQRWRRLRRWISGRWLNSELARPSPPAYTRTARERGSNRQSPRALLTHSLPRASICRPPAVSAGQPAASSIRSSGSSSLPTTR